MLPHILEMLDFVDHQLHPVALEVKRRMELKLMKMGMNLRDGFTLVMELDTLQDFGESAGLYCSIVLVDMLITAS